MHTLPADRDEVRPLGPTRRAHSLRRAVAVSFGVVAILALTVSPLLSLVLFGVALAFALDARSIFGHGRQKAFLGFVAAPFIGLPGVALALLGTIPSPGNFFLLPGLLLVVVALLVLGWSVVVMWLTRPRRRG